MGLLLNFVNGKNNSIQGKEETAAGVIRKNAERSTVKTKIAEAMSNYKSLDFAKKNQKFHKVLVEI